MPKNSDQNLNNPEIINHLSGETVEQKRSQSKAYKRYKLWLEQHPQPSNPHDNREAQLPNLGLSK